MPFGDSNSISSPYLITRSVLSLNIYLRKTPIRRGAVQMIVYIFFFLLFFSTDTTDDDNDIVHMFWLHDH